MNPNYVIFLHVVFVAIALGTVVFPGILLQRIALSGDVAAIRTAYGVGRFHGQIGAVFLVVGVLAGFWAAHTLTIPLGSAWLITAYIAVALLIVLGAFFHGPHEQRIYAVASSDRQDAGAECARLARSPGLMIANVLSGVAWLVAFFVMVVRPS